jgi:F-type H+-transporting ATPase subunit b
MEILNQLGGLVLGSVPTMIMFILLVLAYNVLVQGPLMKTLEERRARTTGAVEQARGAISAAEAETAVYEAKLRAARADIAAARASARDISQAKIRAAKVEIEASAATAKLQIEGATAQLSESILRAVLPAGSKIAEARQ